MVSYSKTAAATTFIVHEVLCQSSRNEMVSAIVTSSGSDDSMLVQASSISVKVQHPRESHIATFD